MKRLSHHVFHRPKQRTKENYNNFPNESNMATYLKAYNNRLTIL